MKATKRSDLDFKAFKWNPKVIGQSHFVWKGKLNWEPIIIIRQITLRMQIAQTKTLNCSIKLQLYRRIEVKSTEAWMKTIFYVNDVIIRFAVFLNTNNLPLDEGSIVQVSLFFFLACYKIRWHLKNLTYTINVVLFIRMKNAHEIPRQWFYRFWLIKKRPTNSTHMISLFVVCRSSDTRKKWVKKTDWRLLVVTSHSDILIGY